MASGLITIFTQSVDYGGGRGAKYSNLILNWNLDQNNYLTVSENSYSTNDGTWWICTSRNTSDGYQMIFQVQYDSGSGFQTIYDARENIKGPCSSFTWRTGTNVKATLERLCNGWGGARLTQPGQLRFLYGASRPPAPDAGYPYAFPDLAYSVPSQIPVSIPVETDYRPGARKINGVWQSLNRNGGACYRIGHGEMRTDDDQPTGNPPSIKRDGVFYNMKKIGENQ